LKTVMRGGPRKADGKEVSPKKTEQRFLDLLAWEKDSKGGKNSGAVA